MQMDEKIAAAAENWTCKGKGEMQQLIIASQRYLGILYQTIIGPMYSGIQGSYDSRFTFATI